MSEITMSQADIDALAGKLDGLADQLSADEQALLLAVFEVAGAAIEAQAAEVEGFSLNFTYGVARNHAPLSEGFRNAFSRGVGGGLGEDDGVNINPPIIVGGFQGGA
jgi:hypothetical protein